MPTMIICAEIELDGVRYSHHYGIPARSWEVADEHMREAFREGARDGLGQHLAASLPVKITVIDAEKQPAPFTPPAHYRRDDGVDCCVHTIPVGPDSCPACRELHDEQPAVEAQQDGEA